ALIAFASRPILEDGLRRAATRRRELSGHSSIEIERSLADVFAFMKDFENFPRVIGSPPSVLDYHDRRSHWEAYSPSGELMEFDAVITKYVPRSVIAWESVPGSVVEMHGEIRFSSISPTRTRIDLQMGYLPQTIGLADAIQALIRAPQAELL